MGDQGVERRASLGLIDPGDGRALADRLRRLFEDEPARACMGREARAVAVERFAKDRRIDDHLCLYRVADAATG